MFLPLDLTLSQGQPWVVPPSPRVPCVLSAVENHLLPMVPARGASLLPSLRRCCHLGLSRATFCWPPRAQQNHPVLLSHTGQTLAVLFINPVSHITVAPGSILFNPANPRLDSPAPAGSEAPRLHGEVHAISCPRSSRNAGVSDGFAGGEGACNKPSGAAGLCVSPKPGFGSDVNMVSFWGRAGALCRMCRQRCRSFRLAERQPARDGACLIQQVINS